MHELTGKLITQSQSVSPVNGQSVQSVVSQGIGESLAYANGVPMAYPWRTFGVSMA